MVEPLLFKIYGKEHIQEQQPYHSYLIDHYWVISGSLNKEKLGGTFIIIIDAFDSRIIKFSHGK